MACKLPNKAAHMYVKPLLTTAAVYKMTAAVKQLITAGSLLAIAALPLEARATGKGAPADHGKETQEQKKERASNPGNLVGHGGPVKAIRVSPDGKTALTGSFDYAMIYWDLSGDVPKIIHRFSDHEAPVSAVAYIPGKPQALAADDGGKITLWDLQKGTKLHTFEGHQSKIVQVEISSDGHWAASASWDRTARLWNLKTLQPGAILEPHQGQVNAVAFAPFENEEVLYTASYDSKVRRWDVASGKLERQLYTHGWGLNVLLPIQKGEALAFGSLRGETGLIDTQSGELSKKLPSHEGPVLALAISQDGSRLAFGGADGAIRVWSLMRGELLENYENPYGPVWALSFSQDGKSLYHGGLDDFATRWQVTPRKPFEIAAGKFPRRFQKAKDMSLGERQFARKCSVCHTLTPEGGNRAGPTLYGLFGRKAGTVNGYAYSNALKKSAIIWSEKTVAALFEQGPDLFTPGSKMPLQKITSREKRDALIAFLKKAGTNSKTPDATSKAEGNKERAK